MVLLSPRLFFLLALILAGSYVLTSNRTPFQSMAPQATGWAAQRIARSTTAVSVSMLETPLEAVKAQAAQSAAVLDLSPERAPQDAGELTVDALVKAMDSALESVPNSLPNLPFLPSLVHDLLKNDPQGIRFGPLPSNVYGQFEYWDPEHPRIVLSLELQRLHREGVPTPLLAAVLVHELDHFLSYMLWRTPKMTRNQNEYSAFRSQAWFISALFHKKDDGDAVDVSDLDPEKRRYYEELKKIREGLFNGHLTDMIRATYGPDPEPAGSPARQKTPAP